MDSPDEIPSERGQALEQLLLLHIEQLTGFVHRKRGPVLRGKESTQDMVQSICREMLRVDRDGRADHEHPVDERPVSELEATEHFRARLYRTALSKMIDRARFYRMQKRAADREQPLDFHEPASPLSPSRIAMAREDLGRVGVALQQLSPDELEVIFLKRICGLPHAEIAQRMGKSPEAVRSLLSRGLVHLSKLVRRDDDSVLGDRG